MCKSRYGGQQLSGVCSSFESCAGAVLEGDCKAAGQVCCVKETVTTPKTADPRITKTLFLKLVGNTARNQVLYHFFADSLASAGLNNDYKKSAYLAQLVDESDYFRRLESGIIDRDTDPALGNNQAGDGSRFQGRGGIHLRGRSNYQLANANIKGDGHHIA